MDLRNSSPDADPDPLSNPAELLHREFKQRLWRWTVRTVLWGLPLILLARSGGAFKFVFVIWFLWTSVSFAGLMLGLKFSRSLRDRTANPGGTPQHRPQAWNPARENDDPDVIDIEAEVIEVPADEKK